MDTPEFLLWAIEYTCPIRAQQDGSDPERTERQLRAARAVSDASREGRVVEGLCVEPPDGFRIEDALAVYGGPAAVEAACRHCPANALADKCASDQTALAGCYGLVPLPADPRPVHAAIERGIEIAAPQETFDAQPRWYALWLDSPLAAEHLFGTGLILDAAPIEDHLCRAAISELMTGLNTAFNAGARLHVTLFPRGSVVDGRWRLVPHCPRCKAEWTGADSRRCVVCGNVGSPAAEPQRMARGKRPYFPLDRLLGEQQAAEFLVRYAAFRAGRQSPDQAESQPPPARRDSPPAG
jgi:hypothetical protein